MLGSAAKLQTARNIALTGAVTGNANFDGSGNVTISTTNPNLAIINNIPLTAVVTAVNYPSGFNQNNCRVLSLEWKTSQENKWSQNTRLLFDEYNTPITAYTQLGQNNIQIVDQYHALFREQYTTTFRLLLMKV